MVRLLAALVFAVICASPAQAEPERARVGTTYTLSFSDDWVEAPSDGTQRTFNSRSRDVQLIVSSMRAATPPERFEQIAHFVVERRVELERELAAEMGQRAEIVGPVVISEDWGASMSYSGSFSGGRQFSYSGAVTRSGVLNLYVESTTLTHEQLILVFGEVTAGLDFGW
jgi:hypothetical protein